MADTMNIREATEYLSVSEDNVILLVGAGELEGEQVEQQRYLTRASVVAYKARQLASENVTQGFEDPDR